MILGSKGFSIVESIVALALVGIVGAMSAQVITSMGRSDAVVKQFTETGMLLAQVGSALMDQANCSLTLGGTQVATLPSLATISTTSGAIVTAGSLIEPQNIRVADIRVTNYFPFGSSNRGVAEITLGIEILRQGQVYFNRPMPLFVEVSTSPTGQVTECRMSGTGGTTEAFCNAVGGFIMAGRCSELDVSGNLGVAGAISVGSLQLIAPGNLSAASLRVNGALSSGSATATDLTYNGATAVNTTASITGTARFNGIASAGNICLGGVCRSFAASSCPAGNYGYGIAATGEILCRPVPPPPPPPPPPFGP